MYNEKKQITVTITDLDDINKVYAALDILFRQILFHYAEKSDVDSCDRIVGGCYLYFKRILESAGFTKEDLEEL
jgi:hypothetical protein